VALFSIGIHKRLVDSPSVTWSNDYHVTAVNILDAMDNAQAIADIEAAILWDNVQIFSLTASPGPGLDGSSKRVAIAGERADADPAVQLPLFNTVRYNFLPVSGRPAIKYLRLPVVEVEVEGFNFTTAATDFWSSTYASPIVALGFVTNAAGVDIAGYDHSQAVQNRQVGWHRRFRPGFHRGWVADS